MNSGDFMIAKPRIAVLNQEKKSLDWFFNLSKEMDISFEYYESISEISSNFDAIFWCIGVFDFALYDTLFELCPNLIWFIPKDSRRQERMGGKPIEPQYPLRVGSDAEEVWVVIKYRLQNIFPDSDDYSQVQNH